MFDKRSRIAVAAMLVIGLVLTISVASYAAGGKSTPSSSLTYNSKTMTCTYSWSNFPNAVTSFNFQVYKASSRKAMPTLMQQGSIKPDVANQAFTGTATFSISASGPGIYLVNAWTSAADIGYASELASCKFTIR